MTAFRAIAGESRCWLRDRLRDLLRLGDTIDIREPMGSVLDEVSSSLPPGECEPSLEEIAAELDRLVRDGVAEIGRAAGPEGAGRLTYRRSEKRRYVASRSSVAEGRFQILRFRDAVEYGLPSAIVADDLTEAEARACLTALVELDRRAQAELGAHQTSTELGALLPTLRRPHVRRMTDASIRLQTALRDVAYNLWEVEQIHAHPEWYKPEIIDELRARYGAPLAQAERRLQDAVDDLRAALRDLATAAQDAS